MIDTHEILKKVRNENQIFLTSSNYFKDRFFLRTEFKYPKALIPNNEITEITGGQIIDSIAVSGYLLLANAIFGRDKISGINYSKYLEALFEHRLNYTTLDVRFKQPIKQSLTFSIEIQLIPLNKSSYNKKVANGIHYFSTNGTGFQEGQKVFSFKNKAALR
jgi:hypothetical protein